MTASLSGRLLRLVPWSSASLFWRVFLVNASLATAGVLLLVFSPLTVSDPATPRQLVLLLVGLVILLVANVLLLRMSLKPLGNLTRLMQRIDLLRPGDRLAVEGARELNVVLATFNEMLDRLELERRVSSTRSVGREEAERRRLARELHDQIGQGLTALLLQLKTILVQAPDQLRDDLLEAQEIARDNLEEVRRIARRLRPTVLDDLGLPYALHALADTAEEHGELTVVRRIATEVPQLAPDVDLALYRIAQEALTNALRHANAEQVEVVLELEADRRVRMGIHDDGRGMLYAADVEGGGVRGMRERALAVGANLSIRTRPGGGTSVSVSVAPS